MPDPAPDLNDTTGCPLGVRCESCGAESPDLAVRAVTLAGLGTACLTLCRRCAAADTPPPITVATAARLVEQHVGHVGRAGGSAAPSADVDPDGK